MKTALQQYIEDLNNGTCKGEEYYLELEKEQVKDAYDNGKYISSGKKYSGEQYFNETYKNNK